MILSPSPAVHLQRRQRWAWLQPRSSPRWLLLAMASETDPGACHLERAFQVILMNPRNKEPPLTWSYSLSWTDEKQVQSLG